MFRRYLQIAALLAFSVPSWASAAFWSGNRLMEALDEDAKGATYGGGLGVGYLVGVADAYGGVAVCLEPTVTVKQTVQVVMNYMRAHPEIWNKSADYNIVVALQTVWPCQKK